MTVPALLAIYNRLTLLSDAENEPAVEPYGDLHITDWETDMPLGPIPEPKFKCLMASIPGRVYDCTIFFIDYTNESNLELEIVLEYNDSSATHRFYTVFDRTRIAGSTIGDIYRALNAMTTTQKITENGGKSVIVEITHPVIPIDGRIFRNIDATKRVYITPPVIKRSALHDFDSFNRRHNFVFHRILNRLTDFNIQVRNRQMHLHIPIPPGPRVVLPPDEPDD